MEHIFKVIVVGDAGVGKTSIITRYVHRHFYTAYRPTIGVDFTIKTLHWDESNDIKLHIWDIAGGEKCLTLTHGFFRDAAGAVIVFDITRAMSLMEATKWKEAVDTYVSLPDNSSIPCVLLANKCDQLENERIYKDKELDIFCSAHSILNWFETSAKNDVNITEAFSCLISKMLHVKEAYPAVPRGHTLKLWPPKKIGKHCTC